MTSVGSWNGEYFTAIDGRIFVIFGDHVRGEPRFYWAQRQADDSPLLTGEHLGVRGEIGGRDWVRLPFDGSFSKRTIRRAVERYVRETLGAG
jgi:hypothetical protein